ncbi:MAG: metal-dependent phosphohydrolase sub domain protein [Chitinophagaceae bacterium]|nr:metal-dependent phosphohydrolase sub domain protein [Chitinophagaceae bacterium]
MDHHFIYKQVEQYVTDLFEKQRDPRLVYHNLDHTKQVVSRANEIAAHYNVTEDDMLVLYTAAWFHDTGYLFSVRDGHERKSADLMRAFMTEQLHDESLVKQIEDCIMATLRKEPPVGLPEQIICDADTYHLGTKEFKEMNKRVRKEQEMFAGYVDRGEWAKEAMLFLKQHHYYTSYCKDLLSDKKQKNIEWLQAKVDEFNDRPGNENLTFDQKNSFVSKGIQTMLRLASSNHLDLSEMADRKANILISVNSIIISVILSVLIRRLDVETYLTIPAVLFLSSSVITIVVSIMATRPKVSSGIFRVEDVIAKKTNLLFFGNFHKATLVEYENAMRIMMNDPEYLYGALIQDIHQLGVVLGRKYRLIHLAYNVFMIGIIISVIGFGLALVLHNAAHGGGGAPVNSAGSPL